MSSHRTAMRSLLDALLDALQHKGIPRDELSALLEPVVVSHGVGGFHTASVAHELRNPLSVIETSAFILAERHAEDPRSMRHIARIRQQTEAVGAMVHELLDEVSGRLVVRRPVDLAGLVGEVLDEVSPLHHRRATLRVEGASTTVQGDARKLRQVIVNLLQNAYEIDVSAEGVEVCVRGLAERVEVCVRDHGPGISPDIAARLFTPFATTKPYGHGLGLSISRDIIERHGGTLTGANAAEGAGAVFTLSLPAHADREGPNA